MDLSCVPTTIDNASSYQLKLHRERKERDARLRRRAVEAAFKRHDSRRYFAPKELIVAPPPPPPAPPVALKLANAMVSVVDNRPAQQLDGPVLGRHVIEAVARRYGMSVAEMLGRSRKVIYVVPRQIAVYLLRTITKKSMPQIGRMLGGRDHTTALHAYRKMRIVMHFDLRAFLEIETLRRQIVGEPPLAGLLPPPRQEQGCQPGGSA